jgi:mono/diheme cytochrome c family protein
MADRSQKSPPLFFLSVQALALASMLILVGAVTVRAQQLGDAMKGMEYASQMCSECHAVRREEPMSPMPDAPRFEDIANSPGKTSIALTAWFQTSHPTMPNISMSHAEIGDIVEYILSLRKK